MVSKWQTKGKVIGVGRSRFVARVGHNRLYCKKLVTSVRATALAVKACDAVSETPLRPELRAHT